MLSGSGVRKRGSCFCTGVDAVVARYPGVFATEGDGLER
jgi:hypothetical protein